MKKHMSRILALLMALMMLMSGMSVALASAAQELGSIEDVEEMLFDAVVEIFPTSTVEQQYIYAAYYEQKGQSDNVDALMATLTSEQLVAFTDYKIANSECIEGCGGDECAVEGCECICHKIEMFNANMSALIELLNTMDMDAVILYIAELRMDELIEYWSSLEPIPTAGAPGYDSYVAAQNEAALMTTALNEEGAEDEETNQMSAEQMAETYRNLVDNADETVLQNNSEAKTTVDEVVQANLDAEASMEGLFSNDVSAAAYLDAEDDPKASEQLNALGALMSGNARTLAVAYSVARSSDVTSKSLTAVPESEIIHDNNILIKLFNYDDTINNLTGTKFKFHQSPGYSERTVDGYKGEAAEDGAIDQTQFTAKVDKVADDNHYPQSDDVTLANLFNGKWAAKTVNISGDGGLFYKSGDYYVYDSLERSAFLNSAETGFDLYEEIGRPWYYIAGTADITAGLNKDSTGRGNFLPFDTAAEALTDPYKYTDGGQSADSFIISKPDLWFGMSVTFDFYMPQGGLYNGEDMVFEFLGDDDVWVFIDDVLVLDIGGTHGARSGSINFKTGIVTHAKGSGTTGNQTDANLSIPAETTLKNLFNAAGEAYSTTNGESKFNEGNNTFKDYSKHTLRFYYLERGGNISYCKLKFNIPTLPPGGLSVEKLLSEDSLVTETTNADYTFKIVDTNETLDTTMDDSPVTECSYQLYENNKLVAGTYSTNESGEFTLKAGQKAHFTSLTAQKTYAISETGHEYADNGKTEWKVVDSKHLEGVTSNGNAANVYVAPAEESGASVVFTNTLKTTSLTVSKTVVHPRPVDADNEYTFKASIKYGLNADQIFKPAAGDDYIVADDGTVTFTLEANEDITFDDLPIGATVEIEEVDTASSVDISEFAASVETTNFAAGAGLGSGDNAYTFTGVIMVDSTSGAKVTFTNTPKIYDLTITKSGLQNGVNGQENLEPYSSTMYSVVCAETGVNMKVAIYGNDSVTISDLPAGTYTVTELTDWSWRYTSESDRTDNKVTLDGTDDNITFTNTREEIYWLDSDCYAENRFTGTGAEATINPSKE